MGSYAAALGMPQFISSSYREYAVDFDDDGRRDLWGSVPDVVGSVANYFESPRLATRGTGSSNRVMSGWRPVQKADCKRTQAHRQQMSNCVPTGLG